MNESPKTCGLGCELPEGHEGLHDDLMGGKWDDAADEQELPGMWSRSDIGGGWTEADAADPSRCGDHHASGLTSCTRVAGHDGAHHNGTGLTWGTP